MTYYSAPNPCIHCKKEYVLPLPYDQVHPAIRDVCIPCYLRMVGSDWVERKPPEE